MTPSDARPAPYSAPSDLPTQAGPLGVRFDFNDGCRVHLPESEKTWRARLSDLDSGNVLFETLGEFTSGQVRSAKRYFVRFRLEVWSGLEPCLVHDYDARGREVLIQFYPYTLGDTVGWLPYAVRFQQAHGCRLTCAMGAHLIDLFAPAYPGITFITPEQVNPELYYATYNIGVFFGDTEFMRQPCDFRLVGLHRTAGHILGVDTTEVAPRIALADDSPPMNEPYVCIATQATGQYKYWNNPSGWSDLIRYLQEMGYRVVCIDQKPLHGHGLVWNRMPQGAEDQTGDRPLTERVRWLRHAAFFVGLSSGLSWLAWAAGTPVVLISGFTHPLNEFTTPYRIINYHVCNSCWNDPQHVFDHGDFLRCPRHKGTDRQFECTRLITFGQVKVVLNRIPGFGHQRADLRDGRQMS